jgi:hypothetical protein
MAETRRNRILGCTLKTEIKVAWKVQHVVVRTDYDKVNFCYQTKFKVLFLKMSLETFQDLLT